MKLLENLERAKSIHPPKWMVNNIGYMVIMGSHAYGVNTSDSDFDVYGFCIPPKELVFPHLNGEILGFGVQAKRFDVWSEHHIKKPNDPSIEYDFSIYNIVKYFQLCMENNPNMIDSFSSLPHSPDEEKIKQLLMDCLEEHYGSLNSFINTQISGHDKNIIIELKELIKKYDIC